MFLAGQLPCGKHLDTGHGAGGGGTGRWQRETGARYLAVIKRASTSSPMPSTSTTSASSYFCTVLEHKVTWEEKGDKLLLGTVSSLHEGAWSRELGRALESARLLSALLEGWCFTENKLHCGVRHGGCFQMLG